MKKLFTILFILQNIYLTAQTWDGSASTDWNTAANWSTNAVPIGTGDVSIPDLGIVANYPKLASNVSIDGFSMTTNSTLDFNGFTLSTSNSININGGKLNNTNVATDIVINTSGSGFLYFINAVVNDVITFNHGSSGEFREGWIAPNTFNFNATFNINNTGNFSLSFNTKSSYNGNVIVNRTVAGPSNIFSAGTLGVGGSLSYTNNAGGDTEIGENGGSTSPISGMINITANPPSGTHNFNMYTTSNNTSGGAINVANAGLLNIKGNSLKTSALIVNGFSSGGAHNFIGNTIVSNITLTEGTTNNGALYMIGNTITGNTFINRTTAAEFREGWTAANVFNGNLDVNTSATGTGTIGLSYSTKSTYNGNLSVTRLGAGPSNIFQVGATGVTGNFSYTNNAGSDTEIGENGGSASPITGTINITANPPTGNHNFSMYNTSNNIAGGAINVSKAGLLNIKGNSLKTSVLIVNGFSSGGAHNFNDNTIVSNITLTEGITNSGALYMIGNTITGNTIINRATAAEFREGWTAANVFNGNLNVNTSATGTGTIGLSYTTKSTYNGNLSVTRLGAGPTNIFQVGTMGVSGNFSYTNNAGGDTVIGDIGDVPPLEIISGTITINSNVPTGNPNFSIYNIQTVTVGGTVSINKPGSVQIKSARLLVNDCSITNYKSASASDLHGLYVRGNFTLTEDATNSNQTYFRGIYIVGNTTVTTNSSQEFRESWTDGNQYGGNATFNRNGTGNIKIAFDQPTEFNKSLFLNSTAGITFTDDVNFRGATNGVIEQLGTQSMSIPYIFMNKTVGSTITLNDPIEVTNNINLFTGKIISTATNLLTLANTATATNFSNNSFVEGPVSKKLNVSEGPFTFPLGAGTYLAAIAINATNPISLPNRQYTANYVSANANPLYNLTNKDASLDHLSAQEYWNINKVGTFTDATFVTPSWVTTRSGGISDLTKLRVARWNGSTWKDEGNSATTGSFTAGTVTSGTAITSFSPFTLASTTTANTFTSQNPLPVSLISFSGKNTVYGNELAWQTTNETNFSHFEIERSENAKKFEKIGEKKANTENNNYEFIDQNTSFNIQNPLIFYRLKMLDHDGKFSYSKIISVENDKNNQVTIFPNPVSDYFTIQNNENIEDLEIVDLTGKMIRKLVYNADNQYDIKGLSKGMYILKIVERTKISVSKIVLN